jgi:hypothetical protein
VSRRLGIGHPTKHGERRLASRVFDDDFVEEILDAEARAGEYLTDREFARRNVRNAARSYAGVTDDYDFLVNAELCSPSQAVAVQLAWAKMKEHGFELGETDPALLLSDAEIDVLLKLDGDADTLGD